MVKRTDFLLAARKEHPKLDPTGQKEIGLRAHQWHTGRLTKPVPQNIIRIIAKANNIANARLSAKPRKRHGKR